MAPAVIERRVQRNREPYGQNAAGQQQALEAEPRIAQNGTGPHQTATHQRNDAETSEQERVRGRRDREPNGHVVRGHVVCTDGLALKLIDRIEAPARQALKREAEPLEGIAPEIGPGRVQRQRGGRREQAGRPQDASPGRRRRRADQIAGPQNQDGPEQQRARKPDIGEHARARAGQQEGAGGLRAERPVQQEQRQHEQAEERHVLGVEEGMRVQAGMQDEQAQRAEGQPSVARQMQRQLRAAPAAQHEEQVARQMAAEQNVAAVFQPQQTLDRQQEQLEGDAVRSIPMRQELVTAPQRVVRGDEGDIPLQRLIYGRAVVVQQANPCERQEEARQARAVGRQEPGGARTPANAGLRKADEGKSLHTRQ